MKVRRLLPAIAMLLVSVILVGTSTYAWFSMNQEVTAKNMQITAVAEDGLVIASWSADLATAPSASEFDVEDNTNVAALADMLPVYSIDAANWYHSASTKSSDGQAYVAAGYTSVTNVAGVDANDDGDFEDEGDTAPQTYYMVNKFRLKSTGAAQDVYVKSITVSGTSDDYDPSIRVLVKAGSTVKIFAPVGTHTTGSVTETAAAATAASDAVTSDVEMTLTAVNTLSAKILEGVTADPGSDVEIYLFYDGEDPACKSDNIVDPFNQKTVAVTFTSVAPNA